jgi:hypothetical protein
MAHPISKVAGVVAAIALSASSAVFAAGAASTFDTGTDGWLLAGDATTAIPAWIATGGNPGGFVNGIDTVTGGVWYWQAPAAFLGDASSSYGQTLSFDLRMRGSGTLFDASDVVLTGGGLSLHLDLAVLPADSAWTRYSVTLSEAAPWKVGALDGPAVTPAQLHAVLGSLAGLRIRGEFITGADNGDLDNVVLAAVPEPESWTLWLLGLALLRRTARRRLAGG